MKLALEKGDTSRREVLQIVTEKHNNSIPSTIELTLVSAPLNKNEKEVLKNRKNKRVRGKLKYKIWH